jgi:hypothetical protein
VAEALVRDLVAQVRQTQRDENQLRSLLTDAYEALPASAHVQVMTIPGVGTATAAVVVAQAVDINRFATPAHFVGYFGVFPEENSSGVDKSGKPLPPGTMRMSAKGNDLVRSYLWNAARSAICHNPAIAALYRRLRAKGKRGDVAMGRCMTKLLHLIYAVWKTNRPFDPAHFDWEQAGDSPTSSKQTGDNPLSLTQAGDNPTSPTQDGDNPTSPTQDGDCTPSPSPVESGRPPSDTPQSATPVAEPSAQSTVAAPEAAVGHKPDAPAKPVVTTADATLAPPPVPVEPTTAKRRSRPKVDFAFLRERVTMEQVLSHLGVLDTLRGRGLQRRGPCPLPSHPADDTQPTFSAHLGKHVFQCFHAACQAHGNVLDLWAAWHQLPLYEAALHLAETFHLPRNREEEPVQGTR